MIELRKVGNSNIWKIIKLSVNTNQLNIYEVNHVDELNIAGFLMSLKMCGQKLFIIQWAFLKTEKCVAKRL